MRLVSVEANLKQTCYKAFECSICISSINAYCLLTENKFSHIKILYNMIMCIFLLLIKKVRLGLRLIREYNE